MSESESESNIESESNHHDDARARLDTVEAYATSNLQAMSAGNMQEFTSYKEDMSEDLIRFAIDEACAAGAPRWSYVRSILQTYERDGIKTVGDAKAAKEKRKGKPKDWHNPALDYQQRGSDGKIDEGVTHIWTAEELAELEALS